MYTFDRQTIDSAGAYLQGQLERFDPIFREPLVDITYTRDISLRTDVGLGDESASFTQSKFLAANGSLGDGYITKATSTVSTVGVDDKKIIQALHLWSRKVSWTIPELASAMQLNRPLDEQKVRALQMAWNMAIDQAVYVGHAGLGTKGLFNSADVSVDDATTGTWSTATADQIIADVVEVVQRAYANSAYAVVPTDLAKGITRNVRRGEGEDSGLLLADLLITDAAAIELAADGIGISCGYDAKYETIKPGYALQRNVIGNHVALVENPRCGSQCSTTGDSASVMKITWKDRIRKAFSTRDEASLEEALATEVMDEASEEPKAEEAEAKKEDEQTKDEEPVTLESLCARIDALEAKLAALTPVAADEAPAAEEEKKDDEPTKDEAPAEGEKKEESKPTADAAFAQDVFARAEILAPGIKLPTVDSLTTDSLCNLKRAALAAALASGQTHDAVSPLLSGVDLAKLPCAALHATFVGASEIIKRENNARPMFTRDAASMASSVNVLEEMNRRNKEFWSRQQQ